MSRMILEQSSGSAIVSGAGEHSLELFDGGTSKHRSYFKHSSNM